MRTKFIFITGGVCSSLGKGLTAATVGLLLETKGIKVAMLKLDPYLNVDPGTMNPYQHGEVYVTEDGAETDLDLGHYYRFTNSPLSKASNATSGQVYNSVIKRERRGDYLGDTVQVIPHITDEIKKRILACANQEDDIDVVLVEIGGTVGDIESLPFLEAIRQFYHDFPKACTSMHLTYVPFIKAAGEFKTKPTQHSVKDLHSLGIFPAFIITRCEQTLPKEVKDKISLFCNVAKDAVIEAVDVPHSIYELPLQLRSQGLGRRICHKLNIRDVPIELPEWEEIVERVTHPEGEITIGVVGKYVGHQDAYKSVHEALWHGAIAHRHTLKVRWLESDKLYDADGNLIEDAKGCDGYLIPGGFGERGWEGKISAATYCRTNRIPYFGICLGMHALVVEYARAVLGLADADSTEVSPGTTNPLICLLSEQEDVEDLGGTMRLGAYPCRLKDGSRAHSAYGEYLVHERHRHRYEFNGKYRKVLEDKGLTLAGTLDGAELGEIAEIDDHPWMVGVQYHPEFKSKPTAPHPLFKAFVEAAIAHKQERENAQT